MALHMPFHLVFLIVFFFFNFYFYFILLYNTVLVLPYTDMNPPWVYMSSQTWTPPATPYHLSGSSPCTSPKHPVFCIEHRLAIYLFYFLQVILKRDLLFLLNTHPIKRTCCDPSHTTMFMKQVNITGLGITNLSGNKEKGMAAHSSILAWRIPMDRGVWQTTVHGVEKNWTQLSD